MCSYTSNCRFAKYGVQFMGVKTRVEDELNQGLQQLQ